MTRDPATPVDPYWLAYEQGANDARAEAAARDSEAVRLALIGLSAWAHRHLTLVDEWPASDVDDVLKHARAALASQSAAEGAEIARLVKEGGFACPACGRAYQPATEEQP